MKKIPRQKIALYFLAPTSTNDREENCPRIPLKSNNCPRETGNNDVLLCLHEGMHDDNKKVVTKHG